MNNLLKNFLDYIKQFNTSNVLTDDDIIYLFHLIDEKIK